MSLQVIKVSNLSVVPDGSYDIHPQDKIFALPEDYEDAEMKDVEDEGQGETPNTKKRPGSSSATGTLPPKKRRTGTDQVQGKSARSKSAQRKSARSKSAQTGTPTLAQQRQKYEKEPVNLPRYFLNWKHHPGLPEGDDDAAWAEYNSQWKRFRILQAEAKKYKDEYERFWKSQGSGKAPHEIEAAAEAKILTKIVNNQKEKQKKQRKEEKERVEKAKKRLDKLREEAAKKQAKRKKKADEGLRKWRNDMRKIGDKRKRQKEREEEEEEDDSSGEEEDEDDDSSGEEE